MLPKPSSTFGSHSHYTGYSPQPLTRVHTFSEFPDEAAVSDIGASRSSLDPGSDLLEKTAAEQNPLFKTYQAFTRTVEDSLSTEELEPLLRYIDENLPVWDRVKQFVYVKSKESGLARTVEYDPKTAQVYAHCK